MLRTILLAMLGASLATGIPLASAAAPKLTPAQEIDAMDFAMHDAVFTLYHESGHLLIDELGLPVLGKEEDAADALATLLILRNTTDPELRHKTISDVADGWYLSAKEVGVTGVDDLSYFDEHSFDIERSYQIVCLAVGNDAKQFADLAEDYGIDEDQRSDCADIYDQASQSWDKELASFEAKSPGAAIPVVYDRPGHFSRFVDELKKRRVLESTAEYLAAHYRLPAGLSIHAELCDDPDAYYDLDAHRIVYCYELAQDVYDRAVANMSKTAESNGEHPKNAE